MIKKLTYFIFIALSSFVYGQDLSEELSESHLSIGQPVILTYRVRAHANDSIQFFPKKTTIQGKVITRNGDLTKDDMEFEILNDFSDSVYVENDQKYWIGKYSITVWDSGAYLIPGPRIYINDSVYEFDNLALACYLSDPVKGIDIYDIKENFIELPAPPFSFSEFIRKYWWLLGGLIVILIGGYFYIKRVKNKPELPIKQISLKDRTLLAIEALDEAKLWEKDQLKVHFIELSFILRSYLTNRYNVSLLEKTTSETKLLLTQKGLNEETIDVIAKILSHSDMVKFAKSKPELLAILNVSVLAKQIVAETSPIEFEHVE